MSYQYKDPEARRVYMKAYVQTNQETLKQKQQVYYAENRDHILAQKKAYRQANREKCIARDKKHYDENRERLVVEKRAYREANHEKTLASAKKSQQLHHDKKLARDRAYKLANPEKEKARLKRYRAQKANAAINDFTHAQWVEMQAAYDHCCVYCGKRAKGHLTQDHITALSKGGNHTLSNIVPSCRSCNSRKNNLAPLAPVQPMLLTLSA